jgi:hypothetical protein
LDKIIFPNGTTNILHIDFLNNERLSYSDRLKCTSCNQEFLAAKTFDQHKEWNKIVPNDFYNPASVMDFLHRECPLCHKVSRIIILTKEVRDMNQDDFSEFEKNTAPKYLTILPGQVVVLKLTGMKKVSKKGFKGEEITAMQFKVLEEDGEAPLADGKKWEVSQLALQRQFVEKVKESKIPVDKVQEAVFNVEVSRVGEGTATKYKMEFK